MLRPLLWVLGGLFGLLLLAVAGVAVFLATGGDARLRPFAEDLATAALGREVRFEHIDADLGWNLTTLHFAGVTVANEAWAGDKPLAELAELDLSLRPRTLIWGPLDLPRIEAHDGALRLARNAKGETNWSPLEGAAGTAAPSSRAGFPQVGALAVTEVAVDYRDDQAGVAKSGTLGKLKGAANQADGVVLTVEGTMDGQSLTGRFSGGSFEDLVAAAAPYPVDLKLAYNGIEIRAKGTVADPAGLEGVDVQAAISGRNFADLYPLIPAALPATPPFAIEGKLARKGTTTSLSDFTGRMGDSDVAGTLTYDTAGKRPTLSGRIASKKLDFDDLAPLIGAAPNPDETANAAQVTEAEQQGLLPDTPIPVERFRVADLDIDLDAAHVVDAAVPVTRLKAHFALDDARLEVKPLELGLEGDGKAAGEVAVNARETVPSADLDLTLTDVDLKPFFKHSTFVEEMGGRFGGHAYLLGTGRSLAEIAATARGQGLVTYREGTVSGLLVEIAGLDVVEALALSVGDDTPVGVRCGGAGFHADDGRLAITQAFIDTTDSLLTLGGWLDLQKQGLDLRIKASPKDFSLVEVNAPVHVYGAIEDPHFTIGKLDDPLPFLELGDQEDVDCQAAYRQLETSVRPKS